MDVSTHLHPADPKMKISDAQVTAASVPACTVKPWCNKPWFVGLQLLPIQKHGSLFFPLLNRSTSVLRALLIFHRPVKDLCTRRGLNFVSSLILLISRFNAEVLLPPAVFLTKHHMDHRLQRYFSVYRWDY